MLRTLEAYLGEERMTLLMRTYAERFRFRHPTPDDFFETAKEVSRETEGPELHWFFEELVEGTGTLDYGVHEVSAEPPAPDGSVTSRVVVRRFGTSRYPIDVRVAFEDGAVRR